MFDFDSLADSHVLVVGDVMLDRYWFGDVDRISPEAPVPVISVGQREERAGGAANVARNVAALGTRCTLLSAVGDDEAGRSLAQILGASGIDCRMGIDPETATTVKLRIISRNQQLIRIDSETPPSHEVLHRCLKDFKDVIDQCNAVILSDYGKGGLLHIAEMISTARDAGVPVIVDPKGLDFARYRGANLITPNVRELEQVVGPWASDDALASAVGALLDDLDIDQLLLTRSEQGMSLFGKGGSALHSQARAREVYDVTGAGDTVIAVVAAAVGGKINIDDALAVANAAAGIVVGKLGTAVVTLAELKEVFAQQGTA